MERFTKKSQGIIEKCANCIDESNCYLYCCEILGDALKRLAYYEDLEEQGRLVVLASKEQEIKKWNETCSICKFYTGGDEPCSKKTCHVYRRLQQLEQIK